MSIFERFNAIRKSKGFTYQDLEDKYGIPKQTLYSLKRRGTLGLKTLRTLADALDISIDQLVGVEQDAPVKNQQVIEAPVWKITDYDNKDLAKYRYLNNDCGEETFGIFVDQKETNYPKGTILYFNPLVIAKPSDLIFGEKVSDGSFCIRQLINQNHQHYYRHLKSQEQDNTEQIRIIGVCVLITTDLYKSLFD